MHTRYYGGTENAASTSRNPAIAVRPQIARLREQDREGGNIEDAGSSLINIARNDWALEFSQSGTVGSIAPLHLQDGIVSLMLLGTYPLLAWVNEFNSFRHHIPLSHSEAAGPITTTSSLSDSQFEAAFAQAARECENNLSTIYSNYLSHPSSRERTAMGVNI